MSKEVEKDPINPDHYKMEGTNIQCIDVVEDMDFLRGNVIKYVWRAPNKENELEDLKKAQWYLERLILKKEREEAGK